MVYSAGIVNPFVGNTEIALPWSHTQWLVRGRRLVVALLILIMAGSNLGWVCNLVRSSDPGLVSW